MKTFRNTINHALRFLVVAGLLVAVSIGLLPTSAHGQYDAEEGAIATVSYGIGGDNLDADIEAKKKELAEMNQRVKSLKDSVAQKQNEINSLNSQLNTIDSRIELIELEIKTTQLDIETTQDEVARTENEIETKEKEIDRQKQVMDQVARAIYMDKDINLVALLVESQTFSELLERTEYLSRVRSQLKDTIDKMKVLKAELEDQKENLENKMASLESLQNDRYIEESTLVDQRIAREQIVLVTRGEEAAYQSHLAQAQAEEQAISQDIIRLVQEQSRRRRSEGVEGRPGRDQVVNTGGFTYPLAGNNRISITGGDFQDPAYGMGFPHRGVDLAASQGTLIYSAGAGIVVAAYDSGNAGLSYIAIDHGNGLITKYLHVSAVYVVAGDIVNAGDPIGLSGGTPGTRGAGLFTTGAHLHFEINDYQGNAINPHNYLDFLPPLF